MPQGSVPDGRQSVQCAERFVQSMSEKCRRTSSASHCLPGTGWADFQGRIGVRFVSTRAFCRLSPALPVSGPATDWTGAPAACRALTMTIEAGNGRALAVRIAVRWGSGASPGWCAQRLIPLRRRPSKEHLYKGSQGSAEYLSKCGTPAFDRVEKAAAGGGQPSQLDLELLGAGPALGIGVQTTDDQVGQCRADFGPQFGQRLELGEGAQEIEVQLWKRSEPVAGVAGSQQVMHRRSQSINV